MFILTDPETGGVPQGATRSSNRASQGMGAGRGMWAGVFTVVSAKRKDEAGCMDKELATFFPLHDNEYNFLCSTVGHCLSVLYRVVCIC